MEITQKNCLYRKLIYTAITRAKKYLIMLGNIEALRKGIVQIEEKRKTKLQDRLHEMILNGNIIFDQGSAFSEVKEEKSHGLKMTRSPNEFLNWCLGDDIMEASISASYFHSLLVGPDTSRGE